MASLLQSLADRLSSLSIIPSESSSSSLPVRSYAFKPKGGSSSNEAVKLVLVAAEESKDIGKASALAKTLGFKDMRAAEDDYVKEIVGEGKASGTCMLGQVNSGIYMLIYEVNGIAQSLLWLSRNPMLHLSSWCCRAPWPRRPLLPYLSVVPISLPPTSADTFPLQKSPSKRSPSTSEALAPLLLAYLLQVYLAPYPSPNLPIHLASLERTPNRLQETILAILPVWESLSRRSRRTLEGGTNRS